MFAIIKTGGRQLKVEKDQTIFVEKIDKNEGETITFTDILFINGKIGTPYVENASVTGIIEKQGKAKKIVVYRHNPKSTHKRKLGHRQLFTKVKITELKG
ncbi:50S ribosomal protein L21 [Mesomycoplasma hyopneumoniae]|uniref:Large ribosomal subunit protein bL21 n=3 Tax=Mesomycoplasma hyopneumoniae TaxID=2099 RepID=RL21_MESH7|nr:50S ribosomal protein L21 [Mesomycoplasma hyopneumoniae]Q4A8N3.1 RecName: Full=Large ribosomal subunit protein bL21; AltName: Full=50S ribosomal protein L21 [Mesomycoplasma hyopneumoniae 7448]Q4AAK2.1 RecName: Full=Large ribosomal subunit protein bL21; AltName: Full=50S ribosomal protein L21 [Mesomycoplasma hyopneumoniae J]CNS10735.1 50S ribosomal protein L21 [Salmonella enterica subsp. enterica serovar Typhimurium str. DT104]AAZ44219.1 50S ribosomal protein L21 [Mesomycoplasma hyopneumoniae